MVRVVSGSSDPIKRQLNRSLRYGKFVQYISVTNTDCSQLWRSLLISSTCPSERAWPHLPRKPPLSSRFVSPKFFHEIDWYQYLVGIFQTIKLRGARVEVRSKVGARLLSPWGYTVPFYPVFTLLYPRASYR